MPECRLCFLITECCNDVEKFGSPKPSCAPKHNTRITRRQNSRWDSNLLKYSRASLSNCHSQIYHRKPSPTMRSPMMVEQDSEVLTELLSHLDALYDSHDSTINTHGDANSMTPAPPQSRSTRKKNRCMKSNGLPYSTVHQRRQKTEIEALRAEV